METEEILPELSDHEEEADWTKLSNKKRSFKRGEKEYEPLAGSSYDKVNLDRARAAMFSALAHPRGVLTKPDALKHYTVWIDDLSQCYMVNPRGKYLETMGQTDREGRCWLTKLEAVYLVERGSCVARSTKSAEKFLSLHELYALLFQQDGLHDKYLVYSHLKRCGYIVNESVEKPIQAVSKSLPTRLMDVLSSFIRSKFIPLFSKMTLLLSRGRFFSYSSLFKSLRISSVPLEKQKTQLHPYRVALSAWKPKDRFSKKNPPSPDFQICIVSAQQHTFPSLIELQGLIGDCQCEGGSSNREKVKNLKFGCQSKPVKVVAVVDNGLINFFSPKAVSFETQGIIWNDACLLDKPGKYKKGKGGLFTKIFISR